MSRVLFTLVALSASLSAFPNVRPRAHFLPRPCQGFTEVSADTTTPADGPLAKAHLRWLGGSGPGYPASLRNAAVDGDVVATYVVDTLGHVMRNTALITTESNRAFGQAVCEFLNRARLAPVTIDGRKRSMRVLDAHFKFSFGKP